MDYKRCIRSLFSLTKANCRNYSRNVSRRKSVKINSPESLVSSLNHNSFNSEIKLSNQNEGLLNRDLPETKTSLNEAHYKMLEITDSVLRQTLHIFRNRKMRERKEKIVLDGTCLINQAIDARLRFYNLYFCHEEDLKKINTQRTLSENPDLFKVTPRTMELFSSSSGVMGVFKKPTNEDIRLLSKPVLPVTILCDNIRDPGNLGSIIRYAAATGCENVLLLKGCTDPWQTKTLKVACGGHFRIPISNIEWNNISDYIHNDSKIFIADNSSDIEHWEHTPELINYDASTKEIEDGSSETAINKVDRMLQENDCNELDISEDTYLPCYLYSSIMYPKEKIVLYVGGETHGVDSRIVKLAGDYGGKKVKIPLENNMDSLNSSFALAIILYEIKRQLSEKL